MRMRTRVLSLMQPLPSGGHREMPRIGGVFDRYNLIGIDAGEYGWTAELGTRS
jgi:hypothetical protein